GEQDEASISRLDRRADRLFQRGGRRTAGWQRLFERPLVGERLGQQGGVVHGACQAHRFLQGSGGPRQVSQVTQGAPEKGPHRGLHVLVLQLVGDRAGVGEQRQRRRVVPLGLVDVGEVP